MSSKFRQFEAFHAVIETGTVTAAAAQLGVSQPAISNLLSQLERKTALKLFQRRRGRLVPTPEATVLFREVDTVVRGLDHVNQAVRDLKNQRAGQLQVASTHALAFGFIPQQIARFCADKPDLTIAFQSQYSGKIQEWVIAGLFEIGVCEVPLQHDGLRRQTYVYETACALPSDSPLAASETVTPQMLDGVPFIAMGPGHMVTRRTREAFHAEGATWHVRCHTDLFRNALNLVRQGLGAALIDPFTLASEPAEGYVVRPFRPRIQLDLMIVTARTRPLSSVGQVFLDQIAAPMADLAVPGWSRPGAADLSLCRQLDHLFDPPDTDHAL